MNARPTPVPADTAIPPGVMRTAWILIVGAFAGILDTTIVAIALDSLAREFDVPVSTIQWISTAYLLALAAAIPLVGWAQARIGGKRLWIIALSVFLLGSVLCATAWDATSLIAFRVVQGIGGGILFPLMQSLAMQAAGGRTRGMGRIMAVVTVPVALGPILGPVIGGLILGSLSWQWLFLVNVPVVLVGIALAVWKLPDDSARRTRARLDVVGLVLLIPGLALLLLGLSNVESGDSLGRVEVFAPFAAGLALVIAFVAWSLRRRDSALVRLRLLGSHRSLAGATGVLMLSGAALFGAMLLFPLYWQVLRGETVLAAGLLLIPQGVGSLLARPVAGVLLERIGPRALTVAGFALIALGTVPFALADAETSVLWLSIAVAVRGFGLGTVLIPLMTVSMTGLEHDEIPQATMITRIAQQVGGAFGTAALAVVLTSLMEVVHGPQDAARAFDVAFWVSTAVAVAAMLLSLVLPGRGHDEPTLEEAEVAEAEAA
ncbi:MDR family MFS transporter [Protaetiibacter intestinalis]|uniref:DHA2 family efflux MFS transporter permease subunit n=1 Tax=Protaetiibacter intestinalis TaxID=2419774 RepID=A0A387B6E3_9MICO|nr:MDR family MFS transporter [Protaetiibacter intestinalis]AYF99324.1 DHA2 family efflux MFS transporter permease subunit [Protaetiibacter intestinalis]